MAFTSMGEIKQGKIGGKKRIQRKDPMKNVLGYKKNRKSLSQ